MKRYRFLFVIGLFGLHLWANPVKPLDTIYVNEHLNMALFFPSEIKKGIVGAENFVFTYNREKGETLGLLKGVPGKQSNLLVITVDGSVYSFMIRYKKELKTVYRFIGLEESIGHKERGLNRVEDSKENQEPRRANKDLESKVIKANNRNKLDTAYIKTSCQKLLSLPERIHKRVSKNGISTALKNQVYHKDLVYLQLELSNKSGIDFDLGFLQFYISSGNKKRKASYQELPLSPVYIYKLPEKVMNGGKARFVIVFKKFVLGGNERLEVLLRERNGNRSIRKIFYR